MMKHSDMVIIPKHSSINFHRHNAATLGQCKSQQFSNFGFSRHKLLFFSV